VNPTRRAVPGTARSRPDSAGRALLKARMRRWAISIAAWSRPNTTYVHAAPCHSPARSIVISRLRAVFHSPHRLPPSGKYR